MRWIIAAAVTMRLAVPAAASSQTAPTPAPAEQPAHHHAMSPYAGTQSAEIKGLSEDELKAYREGSGMGLAKPAELNHYPGPRHVLDMGSDLDLTAKQTANLKATFDRMHAAAVALGEQIIAGEKALDKAFASGAIDEARLRHLTSRLAGLQARLRVAHLKAHLETKRILTAQQVARYDSLRGYTAQAPS